MLKATKSGRVRRMKDTKAKLKIRAMMRKKKIKKILKMMNTPATALVNLKVKFY